MRLCYGMTEIDIAEAMQDLMDTQFANALAAENKAVDGKTSSEKQDMLDDGFDNADIDADTDDDDLSVDDGSSGSDKS